MTVIAIVPARGGSVGLPGKNLIPFHGTPLVAMTVLAAKASKRIDRVFVSSDSHEILGAAQQAGAEPILRPEEISGSLASSESALIHALHHIGAKVEDIVVFLQCTSPFTTPHEIDSVVAALDDEKVASAFSAVEDHCFIWKSSETGLAEGITHDHTMPRQRRQDMEPRYRENGAIYAAKVGPFLEFENRFCGDTVVVPVHSPSIEIDSADDWLIAEAVFGARSQLRRSKLTDTSGIKAIITDFDGVHTDDCVYVSQDGTETVKCSRSDGFGLEILRKQGLRLLILSKETNPVVEARAAKLQMEILQDIGDKVATLEIWLKKNGLKWDEVAYVGNDLNDLGCMQKAGVSLAPSSSIKTILSIADIKLTKSGGDGAIREAAEIIMENRN
ncbi:transferase [Pseudovibrio japonicus]|uniref:N-acylneuraminate cytidylyltransferase n=1 Tax=Pseudovibrio japonicus TaxID=366534 RepID=A0ABQ3EQ38_9HYPH|nr:acylneuraminate cytidylyltransferase [Pseudovibrio japonicus]GHB44443.1 transferase [Pseudovibrio japonicus]